MDELTDLGQQYELLYHASILLSQLRHLRFVRSMEET